MDWRIVRGVVCIKQRGREKLMYRGETEVGVGEVQTMREKSEYCVGGVCVRAAYVGLGVGGRVDTREGLACAYPHVHPTTTVAPTADPTYNP